MFKTSILSLVLCCSVVGIAAQLPHGGQQDSVSMLLAASKKDSLWVVKLNDIAFDYLKFDPNQGRQLALKSATVAQQLGFAAGYSRALNVIGSTYWVVGNYEQALTHYQQSAKISKAANDNSGLSAAYHNMGEVYKKVGNLQLAIKYLTNSLELDVDNQSAYAMTFFNIGEAHLLLKDYKNAHEYFDKALKRATSEDDKRTMAYVYQNEGKIKFLNGQYRGALPLYELATELWKKDDDIRSLIMVYQDFANTYLALNLNESAETYIQQSSRLASKFKAMDLQIVNYEIESEILKRKGDFRKALEILSKHNTLKDSVYDFKKSEQIAKLQASFESESKELENKQLKADQLVKDDRIRTQQFLIVAISIISILALMMAWINFRQHRKLLEVNSILIGKNKEIEKQNKEIEDQAEKLTALNKKLSDLNKSLETRIAMRTDQLKNQNRKLAEFAFMNAHQLRAPIARTMGLINLIQKIELPKEDKVLIKYLENCGRELDQITKDISKSLDEDSIFSENKED